MIFLFALNPDESRRPSSWRADQQVIQAAQKEAQEIKRSARMTRLLRVTSMFQGAVRPRRLQPQKPQ